MKVITRCTIDLRTMEVVSETSYNYFGPISRCKGGGGSAGLVDYPDYMKAAHEDWLAQSGTDAIEASITEVMNDALGSSPWNGQTAYDPDTDLASSESAIAAFAAILSGLVDTSNWASLFNQAVLSTGTPSSLVISDISVNGISVSDISVNDIEVEGIEASDISLNNMEVSDLPSPSNVGPVSVDDLSIADISDTKDITGITDGAIFDDVAAFADQLDDEINAKILPRFRRGMQDINAVVSSAFPIGEAIIEAFRNRDVAKHDSTLRVTAALKNADIGVENERLHLEVKRTNIGKDIEVGRANLANRISVESKNAEIALANERLHLESGQINLNKDLEVSKSNLLKDLDVSKTNLSKELEVRKTNLMKDLDVGKTNLTKSLEVSRSNLSKDVDVSKTNLTKDVDIGKVNLLKDIQVGEIAVRTDVEYKKLYLEGSSQMLRLMMQRIAWEDGYARLVVEANRIKIVAKKEQNDLDMKIDEQDALWDLEVFQHGGNLLAAIGGGTGATQKPPSMAASAIGGALGGIAAGAQIGSVVPGIGAAVGAVVGGIVGLASAFL